MKPLVALDCSAIECPSVSPTAPIWQDILAQAMTGELLAAMNYTSLAEICHEPGEVAEALEHAERRSRPRAASLEWTSPTTSRQGIGSVSARRSCAASRSATSWAA